MDIRKNIITALLLAVGCIINQLVPGIVCGMKCDLFLSVMFVCILLNSEFKNVLLTGIISGFLSAIMSTFPGGQIANFIDKIITCMCLYIIIRVCKKIKEKNIFVIGISLLGTVISGSVFLISAMYITSLPMPFEVLFFTTVLPATIVNAFATLFIYNTVKLAIKSSKTQIIKN